MRILAIVEVKRMYAIYTEQYTLKKVLKNSHRSSMWYSNILA